jgi:hypothetical protein
MILLLLLILVAPVGASTVFTDAPGEMGPAMQILTFDINDYIANNEYTQTMQLHKGWNLVSWHLDIPDPNPQDPPWYLEFDEIMPGPPAWLDNDHGEVYKWNNRDEYYPDHPPGSGDWQWNLNYAYYFNLDSSVPWPYENYSLLEGAAFNFTPSPAWDSRRLDPEELATDWFFMGYAAPGYCKLASVPLDPVPESGDPANFSFEGPFHWLIWDASTYEPYDLKLVKTDDGRYYAPRTEGDMPYIDQIGMLEPGRGYFLGFTNEVEYSFAGWAAWPDWQNANFIPPEPPGGERGASSAAHFQYHPYTHWSYPAIIDTVDLQQCPLAADDEIGVFDGDLCVGASVFNGQFPVVIACWEDDIATPDTVDGYMADHEMTFLWYDQSFNAEAELILPPGIYAAADDPVAPTHSGFGAGFYAVRSFTDGIQLSTQLPTEFKLRQNYPNPFNAETIIPLELPQRSHVRVELFNLRGQSLGIIHEGTENAGWPKIRFNSSGLASGMYFCQVTAKGLERGGRFTSVGKMLLLK